MKKIIVTLSTVYEIPFECEYKLYEKFLKENDYTSKEVSFNDYLEETVADSNYLDWEYGGYSDYNKTIEIKENGIAPKVVL